MKQNIFSILVLSVLLATGCSSKSADQKTNTLRLASVAKIKGLDPIYADDLYGGTEVSYVYDGLLEYHYLKRPYQLKPALAEAMPEVSKDRKTYTFKIKKGVLFQDDLCFKETNGKGRELVAEDFVYSFKRLADPKLNSPGWWIFDGKIVGLNEWREEAQKAGKADYSKAVAGLMASDRYTLKIQLKEPSTQFVYFFAMPFTLVVAKEAVEHYGADFLRNPVGTGPFKLSREETNLNSKLVWLRNPTFRQDFYPTEGEAGDKEAGLLEDAGKPIPFVDKLVTEIFVESQPQWLNFMSGKLDASGIPKDNYAQAISPSKGLTDDLAKKGILLHKAPALDITHDSFNMKDALMGKNKLLRQALSLSIDHDQLIELFYNGRAISAQGPIPPGIAGYDSNMKNPYKAHDIEKAKALLEKAGFPGGKGLPPIEYVTSSSSTNRQMSEFLSKQFAAIGVQLKPNQLSWPEFQAAVKNRKGMMWGFAWGADYPDAENFLQLFYSKNVSPGPNDSNYINPEFDRMYEASLKMMDTPERTELYKKMARMLVEDAPWIFNVHRVTFSLTHPWMKNYKIHELAHNKAKYYRLDLNLRK